jgi:energy-coupling factor transporter ATP-binding protein EcfA2
MNTTCKSLIIDKIVLNNFRLFSGKNEILLGYTPEKYVNFIIGPCGSGKTTIAYALQWALKNIDQKRSTERNFLLNQQVNKSLKNHQKAEVSVQIFLSDINSDRKLKVERKCVYSNNSAVLSLESDLRTVKELKKSRWIDFDKNAPGVSLPVSYWNCDDNPRDLIINLSRFLFKFSNVPNEKLKEMISEAAIKSVREKYHNDEFTIEFEEDGIFQLIRHNYNVLSLLATGDLILLWLSLLPVIRKSTKCHLPLILDSPFNRLDTMKRILIAESLKDNFDDGQLILMGADMQFEPIMDILKPMTNCCYQLEINKDRI